MTPHEKLNTIFLLIDISEQLISEIEAENIGLKQDFKLSFKRMKKNSRDLVGMVNKIMPNQAEAFGDASDLLRDNIENFVNKNFS